MRTEDNDQTSQQNLTRGKLLDKPDKNKAHILQRDLHLLNLEHVSWLLAAVAPWAYFHSYYSESTKSFVGTGAGMKSNPHRELVTGSDPDRVLRQDQRRVRNELPW